MARNEYTEQAPIVEGDWKLEHTGAITVGQVSTIKLGGAVIATYTHLGGDTNASIMSALTSQLSYNYIHPFFTQMVSSWSLASASLGYIGRQGYDPKLTLTHHVTTINPTVNRAPTGPQYWNDARNWSLGTVPVAADTVILARATSSLLYNLDQSALAAYAGFVVESSFLGDLGFRKNAPPDFDHYFKTKGATGGVNVGFGVGAGSRSLRFDGVANSVAWNVYKTGGGPTSPVPVSPNQPYPTTPSGPLLEYPCVEIKNNNIASTLFMDDGHVAFGLDGGTSNLASIKMNRGILTLGGAVVLQAAGLNMQGGVCRTPSTLTNVIAVNGAAFALEAAADVSGTAEIKRGARIVLMGTGKPATLILDRSRMDILDPNNRTIATGTFRGGKECVIWKPHGTLTVTAASSPDGRIDTQYGDADTASTTL